MDDKEKYIDAARETCLPFFLETGSRLRAAGFSERDTMLAMLEMTRLVMTGDMPGLLARAGATIARIRSRLAGEGFEEKQVALVMSEIAAMFRGIAAALEDQAKLPPFAAWSGGHG